VNLVKMNVANAYAVITSVVETLEDETVEHGYEMSKYV